MTAEQVPLGPETLEILATVSAATVSMQLLKRGIRNASMIGPRPLDPAGPRVVGPAYTLRFLPAREDLATLESYARPGSIRQAIEEMPAGQVVVIDARGEQGAATLGDILAARLKARGALAVVSDGPMRDVAEIRPLGLPVFCTGAVAPPSIARLAFTGWQETIGCGGAAVIPGDVIVADEDGAVVVPRALADEVARDAVEQERFERFVQIKVKAGAPVQGLYPPSEETLAAYQAWLKAGEPES
ncbi:MAG: ribonuclease activity regulator RraA [Rhodospirillales bacterium]|nr:ribonuclease activity regulator RraA [Rhodospirillales bacterium]